MFMRRIAMTNRKNDFIGYACAYTPLALIMAAGLNPYRVLPMTESPENAGMHLHDNMCPHIKKILDRAMSGDLPELKGMVFMNSCDAMRRLSDAWRSVKGSAQGILIDLPVVVDELGIRFFAGELKRLAGYLESISGLKINENNVLQAVDDYNGLTAVVNNLADKVHSGNFINGSAILQKAYNAAATEPPAEAVIIIKDMMAGLVENPSGKKLPAIFLFGNVLPDPEAFELFEDCGAHIIDDDLCTGSRMFQGLEIQGGDDIYTALARSILNRRPCARTFDCGNPGRMTFDVLAKARAFKADGVICHTAKFCDPYLARIPFVIETLRNEGIPMLMLEGDCTTRSIGQHRTRIEAFIEMLG
jgi:benzoyl-CoA reductase/2-hydroxyglutaryl-CoA dehydratase subunit BcrC/BadD/HgdB